MKSPFAAAIIITVLTIVSGTIHGRMTLRWGQRPDVIGAGKRLKALPDSVGAWKAVADIPLADPVVKMLQCAGHVNRTYKNSETGDRVAVAVLLGPSGPMAVHTPEVCYSARDYRTSQGRVRWGFDCANGDQAEFWDVRLKANDLSGMLLRVLYGWTRDGNWHASQSPRFEFAGSPFLYKLQLAGPPPTDGDDRDVCEEFLAEFLPQLKQHMLGLKQP